MKAGWQRTKLGDVALVSAGNSAPQGATFFTDGIYPFFRTSDAGRVKFGDIAEASDYLNEDGIKGLRCFPVGTILFPKSGASTFLNHRVMLAVDGYVSSHLATIVADEWKVDKRFLLYFLRTVSTQDLIQDHAYPSLNLPLISGVDIEFPPLPEQHRIVAFLDEAFAAIATARANTEQNLQNARAVFESYLQEVFSQRGEGWAEKAIGDICSLKSGTSVDVSFEKPSGDLPYLKVADMSCAGNEMDIVTSSRFLNMADAGKKSVFPAGATIFPKRGGAILTNKKRLVATPICADLNIMGVIPPSYLSARFLYYYFLNVDMRLLGSGSSIPQINNYDIAPLRISFPEDQAQQSEIVKKLDSLNEETQHLESLYQRKLSVLDELKQSLLHQAFSGKL
jgi:type I restriction enzyme S subunit